MQRTMDLTTPVIFVSMFGMFSLILFLVYKFGMKEKSYEEAVAEQRQQTSAFLASRPKPKDKKIKKAAKKSKEKINPSGGAETETTAEETDKESPQPSKLHVEFKDDQEEIVVEELQSKEGVQNKRRVKRARPILVKKETSPNRVPPPNIETPPANRFEEIHPKDDVELKRSHSKDDLSKSDTFKEKSVKKPKQQQEKPSPVESSPTSDKDDSTKAKKLKQNPEKTSPQEKEQVVPKPVVKPPENPKGGKKSKQQQQQEKITAVEATVVSEKEKDKEERVVEVSVTQVSTENAASTGKEKKKKKSDVNVKQHIATDRDQLLNSVRKAELSRSEVQMLIDLLLNKQLEAPAVIDEWSEGKADPMQKLKKQLAEKEKLLAEEQEAVAGAQAKVKEVRAEQVAERLQLQQKIRSLEEVLQNKHLEIQTANNRLQVNGQKIQQLQAQINEEMMKTQRIIEENNELQIQRQQFEVRMVQVQETEGILVKLRTDNDELIRQNQYFGVELQRLSQDNEENKERQQLYVLQLTNKQNELEQLTERTRQLEEARQDMERKLEMSLRQENDWKMEISKLNSALQQQFEEKRRVEFSVDQLQEELGQLKREKTDALKLIAQLQSDNAKLNEANDCKVNGSSEELKAHELRVFNLTNELTSLKSELSSVRSDLEKKYHNELEETDSRCKNLQLELDEQRSKNNKLTTEIREKERDAQRQFMLRLFPQVDALRAVSKTDDWQDEFGRIINEYVEDLAQAQKTQTSPQDVGNLQAQVQHYKRLIDDTEDTLNSLQLHIEREERTWRNQLAAKDQEIGQLKENCLAQVSRPAETLAHTPETQGVQFAYKCIEKSLPLIIDELQTKVSSLEQQLTCETSEKQRLVEECRVLREKPEVKSIHLDATATIEKLSEEVNRLREQLRVEQKNGEVIVPLKAQNGDSNATNGSALIEGNGNS